MATIRQKVSEFVHQCKQALSHILNRTWHKKTRTAEKNIREFTKVFFKTTETYRSLVDGGLQGSFGFPAGSAGAYADWIVDTIADSIQVKMDTFKPSSGQYLGSIHIILPESAYKTIYTGLYSKVAIEGGSIPWTEWLLKRGDEILIKEFHVVFTEGTNSRGGIAIMGKGGSWKIPAKYSGTEGDNWITRTMRDGEDYSDGISGILTRDLLG